MENITDRLDKYMLNKHLNDNKITVDASLSVGLIGKARKSGKGLHSDTIEKILYTYKDLNPIWFVLGTGNMIIDPAENTVNEPQTVYHMKTDRDLAHQLIPLYDIEATASIVELFRSKNGETKPIDYISIPNLPKCDGAVYVTGDSMYPLLKSGDIVMYKKLENTIDNIFYGEMYLISINLDGEDYVTVKWLHKSDKGEDFIKIASENRHHQPKDIHIKNIKAMALIKASIRINSMS